MQNSYAYGAWGEVRAQSITIPNIYGYTGREFGEEGLYYYRERYLDPRLGRFAEEDLIRFSKRSNLYSYVQNDPTNFNDPFGYWMYNLEDKNVRAANPDTEAKLWCMERELGGTFFVVTTGQRDEPADSAHKSGDAADISGWRGNITSRHPCEVTSAAKKCGFKRAYKSTDPQSSHFHVDNDPLNLGGYCGGRGWGGYYDPCICNFDFIG